MVKMATVATMRGVGGVGSVVRVATVAGMAGMGAVVRVATMGGMGGVGPKAGMEQWQQGELWERLSVCSCLLSNNGKRGTIPLQVTRVSILLGSVY